MTPEDRQQLITKLHELSSSFYNSRDNERGDILYAAADELERLAAENEKLRKRPLTIAPRVMDNGEIR